VAILQEKGAWKSERLAQQCHIEGCTKLRVNTTFYHEVMKELIEKSSEEQKDYKNM
jgi:hypothetical protein